SARPILTVYSMAFSLGTGRLPGWPRHTGQTLVLGGAPNTFSHPQNIFVAVASSTWHSSPITVSNSLIGETIAGPSWSPAGLNPGGGTGTRRRWGGIRPPGRFEPTPRCPATPARPTTRRRES